MLLPDEAAGGSPPQAEEKQPAATPAENQNQDTSTDADESTEARHSEGGDEAEGDKSEQRPSRAERRINQLTEKLKAKDEPQKQAELPPWLQQQQQPTLEGEVTAEQLQQFIASQAQNMTRLELERYKQELSQQRQREDFGRDIEQLVKENPELDPNSDQYDADLDNALQELFESSNDLQTGRLNKKASDIFKAIKNVRQKERDKGSKETTASMAEKLAEQAVAPSRDSDTGYSEKELKKLLNTDPGKVRQILENQIPRA